ncbi:MAG: anaerobic ribonucleoside triphosphate reductase, partial [Epulopiscium sp.]|nr:anaerobic ribonucleoside triphosphate reductase [Candidatus Epulonipiscium sp.]
MLVKIKKRDGREAPFNIEKIANAIFKAAQAAGGQDYKTSLQLSERIATELGQNFQETIPEVEDIQDMVEKVLIESGHVKTAKEYILYRANRTRIREMNTKLMKV